MPLLESASPQLGDQYERDGCVIHFEYAEKLYDSWQRPTCIIVDGPYGVSGFPGDQHKADELAEWYAPHIEAWSRRATPETTLWFWNTEVGWATVHPVLVANEWEYRCCYIWDKGMSHVAGNANTQTLRKFPIVTEVCVQYMKAATFEVQGRKMSMQGWLRREWQRSGLSLRLANDACGVLNAATRKYLTADHLWYYPPPEMFARLAAYANQHGRPEGRPYFSIDGKGPVPEQEWAKLRAKFYCEVGVTNVWREPQLNSVERIRGVRTAMRYKFTSLHGSQKPLRLIEFIVRCCTDPGDVVWEPFGGLCPGAVISHRLQRDYRAAEIVPEFYLAATQRLAAYAQ
ncbi:MAG: DNA methyltransferase [Candidatus Entotheonellia bacterium]